MLQIIALAAIAAAQPVYDLLARHANFFVAHGSRPLDLLALVALLSLALPAAALALEGGVALLSRRAGRWLHVCIVALLGGLIGVQALAASTLLADDAPLVSALAWLALAACTGFAFVRFESFRRTLELLSLAALVFPVIFLFFSPVRALLLPGGLAPGGASAGVANRAPVVILILDELPLTSLLGADAQIDAQRFPGFARFAKRAHWFRNATTVAERTSLALPAILTGRYPDGNRLATAEAYPQNLFSLFGESHRFSVLETQSSLCPAELCASDPSTTRRSGRSTMLRDAMLAGLHVVLPPSLTLTLPVITESWGNFGAEQADEATSPEADFRELAHDHRFDSPWLHDRFLRSFEWGGEQTLFFLHLSLPHVPWRYLPSGHEYRPAPIFPVGLDPNDRDLWGPDAWPVAQSAQRHLLQVGYADKLVGEMLDALERAGLYDDALVAIVSDHGVGLQPGERRRGLSAGNLAEILCVPLMIKLPGQREGVIDDRNAETVDLLPSIADALGAQLPWPVDGRSLFGPDDGERETKTVFKRLPDKQSYERLQLSPDELARARGKRVAALQAQFGAGPFDPDLFAIGPHAELVGRTLSQLRVADSRAVVGVSLDNPTRQLANVDPESQILPVRITGSASSDREDVGGIALAVVVNGELRAVTRTARAAGGRADFSAMIPESALRSGRNSLEIFVVREDADGPTLEATWFAGPGGS